jgi:hypothetical protein
VKRLPVFRNYNGVWRRGKTEECKYCLSPWGEGAGKRIRRGKYMGKHPNWTEIEKVKLAWLPDWLCWTS